MAFGIAREQTARLGERGFVMEAGEDVENFALDFRRVADAVGRDEGQLESAGEIDGGLIARFFLAIEMALQFDIDVAGSERAGEAGEGFGGVVVLQREGERAFVASGEAEQAVGELGEIFKRGGRLIARLRIFRSSAQFHAGDQAAEILIAGARLDKERVASSILRGYFSADVGLDAGFFRAHVKAGGTVDAIDIGERHGGAVVRCSDGGVFLRDARAAQETEGGTGVELDVSG